MDVEAQQQHPGDEMDEGGQAEEAQRHKRLSQAWRESLHALAQNLKCPICLGLMHSAAVAPCYHFACKQCWDQLLAAASGGGVHSVCPMCKAPVSRRSVQECEAYNAMTRELQKAIPAFGFAIDDSCNVTDPLEEPKPKLKPFVPLVPRPASAASAAASAASSSHHPGSDDGGGSGAQGPRKAKRRRAGQWHEEGDGGEEEGEEEGEGEERASRTSSALLREAEEAFQPTFVPAAAAAAGAAAPGAAGREEDEEDEESRMQEQEEGEEGSGTGSGTDSDSDSDDGGRSGWGCEPPVAFEVGALVEVAPRTWPGINKEGGTGRVTARHDDGTYDVKFVVTGGHEARIPPRFVRDGAAAIGLGSGGGVVGGAPGGERAGRATRHSMGSPLGSARSKRSHASGSGGGGGGGSAKGRRGSAPARTNGGGRAGRAGQVTAPPAPASAPPKPKSRKRPAPSSSSASSSVAAAAKENRPPPPSNIPAAAAAAASSSSGHEASPKKKVPTAAATAFSSAASSASAARQAPAPPPPPPEQQQQYGAEGDTYIHRPQEMVILPTSLPHALLAALDAFVARFGGRIARQPGPDVTHVVGKADGRQRRAEARTIKYLHGLLYRRWLLASSWVTDSLAAGRLEPEHRHELTGDAKAQEPSAPTKARLSRYKRTPGLFAQHVFALYGDFPPPRPARRDLESLIAAGGGRVVPVQELAAQLQLTEDSDGEGPPPPQPVKYLVLCNSLPAPGSGAAPPPAALLAAQQGGQGQQQPQWAPAVNSDWLLDSISNYRMMPFSKYRVVLR